MSKCLLLIHIVISLLLAGCGSSTQEDFANRVGQAMRAPTNDLTTASSLGSLRRVAMSAATSIDATSITPDQLFDWATGVLVKKDLTSWPGFTYGNAESKALMHDLDGDGIYDLIFHAWATNQGGVMVGDIQIHLLRPY